MAVNTINIVTIPTKIKSDSSNLTIRWTDTNTLNNTYNIQYVIQETGVVAYSRNNVSPTVTLTTITVNNITMTAASCVLDSLTYSFTSYMGQHLICKISNTAQPSNWVSSNAALINVKPATPILSESDFTVLSNVSTYDIYVSAGDSNPINCYSYDTTTGAITYDSTIYTSVETFTFYFPNPGDNVIWLFAADDGFEISDYARCNGLRNVKPTCTVNTYFNYYDVRPHETTDDSPGVSTIRIKINATIAQPTYTVKRTIYYRNNSTENYQSQTLPDVTKNKNQVYDETFNLQAFFASLGSSAYSWHSYITIYITDGIENSNTVTRSNLYTTSSLYLDSTYDNWSFNDLITTRYACYNKVRILYYADTSFTINNIKCCYDNSGQTIQLPNITYTQDVLYDTADPSVILYQWADVNIPIASINSATAWGKDIYFVVTYSSSGVSSSFTTDTRKMINKITGGGLTVNNNNEINIYGPRTNCSYILTTDTLISTDKTYFQYSGGSYIPVTNPSAAQLSNYYEDAININYNLIGYSSTRADEWDVVLFVNGTRINNKQLTINGSNAILLCTKSNFLNWAVNKLYYIVGVEQQFQRTVSVQLIYQNKLGYSYEIGNVNSIISSKKVHDYLSVAYSYLQSGSWMTITNNTKLYEGMVIRADITGTLYSPDNFTFNLRLLALENSSLSTSDSIEIITKSTTESFIGSTKLNGGVITQYGISIILPEIAVENWSGQFLLTYTTQTDGVETRSDIIAKTYRHTPPIFTVTNFDVDRVGIDRVRVCCRLNLVDAGMASPSNSSTWKYSIQGLELNNTSQTYDYKTNSSFTWSSIDNTYYYDIDFTTDHDPELETWKSDKFYITISNTLTISGHLSQKSTQSDYIMFSYAAPTIAYRNHRLGINTKNIDSQAILDIHSYIEDNNNYKYIRLDPTIIIDI